MAEQDKQKPPFKKSYYIKPGLALPAVMNEKNILTNVRNFEFRDDDVVLLTYPKAGTNWTCAIIDAIQHIDNLKFLEDEPMLHRVPLLELGPSDHPDLTEDGVTDVPALTSVLGNMPSPRKIPSHLTPEFSPRQLFTKHPKTVLVERNPKDVIVSLLGWHNSTRFLAPTEWEYLIDRYLAEDTMYGSYFQYTKDWLKYKNEPWLLWLRFEDMKKDPRGSIDKIAKFIGKNLTEEQLSEVVRITDFKYMKEQAKKVKGADLFLKKGGEWQRKGVSGDWKNTFTVAQNEAFDKLYAERMKGYEEYMYKY